MGANHSQTTFDSYHDDWPWVWGIRDASHLDWKIGLSNEEIEAGALRQRDLPVPITDHVYLGNAASVQSATRLVEGYGITAVLNMAGPMATCRKTINEYGEHGIEYKRIDAEDELGYPLLEKHWKEAFEFIEMSTTTKKNGKKGGKCVVHCAAGMNRSGLVVAAYYMLTTQTPVLETMRHVRKQRGNVALCNEGFQQQLVAMARKNNLLGPQPGTEESIIQQVPPPAENDWTFASTIIRRKNPLDRL